VWQALGKGAGSIIADRSLSTRPFRLSLAADSPAAKIGFKPFDYTKAGVYGDAPG